MEKYIFTREIGSGSFGKVFLVKSKQNGINYVVKQVDLNKLDRKQSQSASKEVEVLAKLRHANIVSYKESYEKNNQLNIVLEYCENGDLYDKIKEKRVSNKLFGDNEILDYFVQICLALEYIHSQKILHRDLKTKNIFLTKGNVIKLGDFGIAKVLENSFELAQTCIGSPFYVSPEICESKPYNKKSDVWALGCVLYELATLRYAFVAKNVKNLVTKILTGAYNPLPSNMNIQIRSLISAMLKPNPRDRPSVRELLEKRFLMKRRATFTCKAYKSDLIKKRSQSGDFRRNGIDVRRSYLGQHSLSCFQLNRSEYQRKFSRVSNLESKYSPPNNNNSNSLQVVKLDKKLTGSVQNKNETAWNNSRQEKNENSCPNLAGLSPKHKKFQFRHNIENKNSNLDNLSIKLPKVDSEYYDLIAGRKNLQTKPTSGDVSKISQRPETKEKTRSTEQNHSRVSEDDKTPTQFERGNMDGKERNEEESAREQRKRWLKNTLQRNTLLAILSDTELLEGSFQGTSEGPIHKPSIDDMLRLKPSEISDDILLPVKLHEMESADQFRILQREVNHLREKFETNNRSYQMEDLITLTDDSKKIFKLETSQKFTESDRKMEESVYHDLECRKMTLERTLGFCRFFEVYGRMTDIINEEIQLKTSSIDGFNTYIISKDDVSGDNDDVIMNTWKSIIDILNDKQEHLPDLWELAMSENIYYHL